MRPPGYEPGELPTAPLRDIFLICGCKGTIIFLIVQILLAYFYVYALNYLISLRFCSFFLSNSNKRATFAHVLNIVQFLKGG